MDLSIIILNYNTKDLTLTCIDSIVNQYSQELDNGKFEIVLVDNASSDDSVAAFNELRIKMLKSFKNPLTHERFNPLIIVESKENTGFSKGCNLGAKNAKGKYLLFLNSDTEIKDQGFLKMLTYFDDKKTLGILGAKLKNEDGSNQLSCGKFYNLFNLFLMLFGFNKFLRESPNIIKKVDWVSGASLMIRRNLFQKLGGFDKDIFMYLEDMELCFRANKNGLDTYFFPEIMLFHKEGRSSGRTFAIFNIYKSTLIFYKKHKSKLQYNLARLMLKTKAMVLVILGKMLNNKYLLNTYTQCLQII
jgi:GT2 family glycosyltransferase